MPRFGKIRKIACEATSVAERARDASKERLSSVPTDQLSQRVRDASDRAMNATTDAARSTTTRSKEFVDEATEKFSDLTDLLQGISDEAMDKLFPECPAPMYIMPTGSGPDAYALVFDFDEILENLNNGVFVRPKIEAWSSGYGGYDIDRFSEELKREFTNQFALAREQRVQSSDELEAASRNISDKMASDFGASGLAILTSVGIATALGVAVVALGPGLLAVILLLFALGYGKKALSLVGDLRKERARSGGAKRELNRKLQDKVAELDELDSKGEAFQRAAQNIEIRTHPKLQELHRLICDIEGVIFQSGDATPAPNAPDIKPYLGHPEFLRKLPSPYQDLLTLI